MLVKLQCDVNAGFINRPDSKLFSVHWLSRDNDVVQYLSHIHSTVYVGLL